MSNDINWDGLRNALRVFAQVLSETSAATALDRPTPAESTSMKIFGAIDESNPLNQLPFEIQDNITTEFYETGRSSMMQKFIEESIVNSPDRMQKLFNDLYHYAVRTDSHVLAWNILVVLSQIPYIMLGSWADMLAVAATRNPYLDIQEMGIRCFENWENMNACSFLEKCSFSEEWLQEYANEVCAYIKEEGLTADVLSQKNYSWQVAGAANNSSSNIEGYSSGYSSSRV